MLISFFFFHFVFSRLEAKDGLDKYHGWSLFEINLNSTHQPLIQHLENIHNVKIIDLLKGKLHFGVGLKANREKIDSLLKNLKAKMIYKDIGKFIEKKTQKWKRSLSNDYFDRYMNYEQMESYFNFLEKKFPQILRRISAGKSYERRDIPLFILSSNSSNNCNNEKMETPVILSNERRRNVLLSGLNRAEILYKLEERQLQTQLRQRQQIQRRRMRNKRSDDNGQVYYFSPLIVRLRNLLKRKKLKHTKKENPIIFIEAGLHPREWVSPAAALYLIKKLTETPLLMSGIDWFIMPMVNPDGYKFTWDEDRFWRKTRSKSGTTGCYGVDMNRNFNSRWGEVDSSRNPCSENYAGLKASSEVETSVVKNVVAKGKKRIKAYISLHNWGQDILYPYCHSTIQKPNKLNELQKLSKGMAKAIKKSQNADYRTGAGSTLLYPASGTSIDWAYDAMGIENSFLIELRDRSGALGFILPDHYIKPTGEDLFAAVSYLAQKNS